MALKHFCHESVLPFSREDVFSYHMAPKAIDRMTPPFMKVDIVERGSPMDVGSLARLRVYLGPFYRNWVAKHTFFCQDTEFCDEQIEGPMPVFEHQHIFLDEGIGCLLKDVVLYKPPFYIRDKFVKSQLLRMFTYRHQRLQNDLKVIENYPIDSLKILVSGSSGFVGSELCSFLEVAGHRVFYLKRGKSDLPSNIIGWSPSDDNCNVNDFEGFDAVIHLSGENIAKKSWSDEQKDKIFKSRSRDTWHLSQILAKTKNPPKVFISASAVGIYGDRGAEPLSEESLKGDDFLSEVCIHWERASEVLDGIGVRRCQARFGYIFSPKGGMLEKILLPFRLGLGGNFGDGSQYMPWVSLDDIVYSLYHLLMRKDLHGPFNICAPKAVQQKDFTKILANVLCRPSFCHVPRWVIRLILKERADALLLRSANTVPKKLLESGYTFQDTDLRGFFSSFLS